MRSYILNNAEFFQDNLAAQEQANPTNIIANNVNEDNTNAENIQINNNSSHSLPIQNLNPNLISEVNSDSLPTIIFTQLSRSLPETNNFPRNNTPENHQDDYLQNVSENYQMGQYMDSLAQDTELIELIVPNLYAQSESDETRNEQEYLRDLRQISSINIMPGTSFSRFNRTPNHSAFSERHQMANVVNNDGTLQRNLVSSNERTIEVSRTDELSEQGTHSRRNCIVRHSQEDPFCLNKKECLEVIKLSPNVKRAEPIPDMIINNRQKIESLNSVNIRSEDIQSMPLKITNISEEAIKVKSEEEQGEMVIKVEDSGSIPDFESVQIKEEVKIEGETDQIKIQRKSEEPQ